MKGRSELDDVIKFLSESYNYKKCKRLVLSSGPTEEHYGYCKAVVDKLDHAKNFNELLDALDHYECVNTKDQTAKKLGAFGMQSIFWGLSFVNKTHEFHYHASHLHEAVLDTMSALSYARTYKEQAPNFN